MGAVGGLWNAYVELRAVRDENEFLRRELDAVRLQWQVDRAGAQRVRGLEALLGLRDNAGLATVGARIIAGDATPYFRTVTPRSGAARRRPPQRGGPVRGRRGGARSSTSRGTGRRGSSS